MVEDRRVMVDINVSVKTQKCSDNYQNMRIMLAELRFKKWEKLCPVFSNYASKIHKSLLGILLNSVS